MGACAKFIVILLIMHICCMLICSAKSCQSNRMKGCATNAERCKRCHKSNVNTEAEKNQTHAKRDTSRIDRPQTKSDDMVKGTYRIIDNEISKTDDTNKRDSSETETQTSVTLIFLNASYKTEVTTLETQNSEENSSTEEKRTGQPTSLVQEQTTNNLVSKKPYSKPTQKEPCQRGILDLLLPAERVQIFKSYFNSFKRFLSATF